MTKTQKSEILEAYKDGDNTNVLAIKYNCTTNTINRTVKTLLSETEYNLLKKKRSKIINKSESLSANKTVNEIKQDFENENSLISSKERINVEDLSVKVSGESFRPDFDEITSFDLDKTDDFREQIDSENQKNNLNNDSNNQNFEEIAPLISSFDFDMENQKSDFEILNYESLPESVYMIVDKKVELELQLISDLPEWSFLPENELKRNAILLFSNQRSAKRICSRNQRVIKIPNTSVFKLSKSYLISKGITRLILEDSIIGLDD
ncbi:hypothetical protein [Prochlorococcus marinus]|uniref:hypothetical protein n=1 Tax=Prochlorococcus marinus TaxID=1219 RepID=UPI0022B462DF|nr:hypothetical protein [Prochlorococcus marinus]